MSIKRDRMQLEAYKEFIKSVHGQEMIDSIDDKINAELTNHILHIQDAESFEKERLEYR